MTYRILTGCFIYTHKIISFMRVKKMSTIFTKKINPVTGKLEWEMQDENYDFHQEIARSAFADMLHDEERNRKYYEGIRLAVEKMHRVNKQAHVLDIGTGTGLLSMMAAACGADSIVACESFKPVADCAEKVIAENGYADKIRLVPKRSTELVVGENGDMEHRANILVTEIFDTELIGEGALSTFKHAHDHLLEKDCIVVPSSATIYAQVIQSETVVKWNKLLPFTDPENGKILLDIPSAFNQCPGAAAVHDIQLNQLSQSEFVAITDPVPVFKFDWLGCSPLKFHEASTKTVIANQSGTAQGVFMWWDLVMDMDEQVTLSCAPSWAHPDKAPAWRDHWMQAVYYLPEPSTVAAGEALLLTAYHDEYSLWFSTCKSKSELKVELDSPVCSCYLHLTCSRTRIGMMNDTERRDRYVEVLRPLVMSCDTCLCLGEASLLGLLVARLGVRKVYCVEENSLARHVLQTFLTHNKLNDCVVLAPSIHSLQSHQLQQVTLMLCEPHFNSALLPWQNLYFWYLKKALAPHLCNSLSVVPRGATIWAMAVEFEHLWKIRAPLHAVEGFKMNHFDALIENSRNVSDSIVEPQPLWEYPCRALSRPFHVLEYNFLKDVPDSAVENSGSIPFESDGNCHGVALWMEWDLDGNPKHSITTGPVVSPDLGNSVRWDMHTRQGVYFFPRHYSIVVGPNNPSLLFQVCFQPHDGDVNFSFKVSE